MGHVYRANEETYLVSDKGRIYYLQPAPEPEGAPWREVTSLPPDASEADDFVAEGDLWQTVEQIQQNERQGSISPRIRSSRSR